MTEWEYVDRLQGTRLGTGLQAEPDQHDSGANSVIRRGLIRPTRRQLVAFL